jgi:hypothetical protein
MKITRSISSLATRSALSAILAGIIATIGNSVIFTAARTTGISTFNGEFLIARAGGVFSLTPLAWLYGLVLSLFFGGLVGWFYSLGFRGLRKFLRSGWDTGIGFGVVHWLIAGVILGAIASSGSMLGGPGYFGVELGWPTFTLLFLSHLLYGAIVGGLYLPPAQAIDNALRPAEEEIETAGEYRKAS